jgi:hypothetical protein
MYAGFYNERQSSSPIISKRHPAVDESSAEYQAAMNKLYDAAWKFDRGKNGDLLKVSYKRDNDI